MRQLFRDRRFRLLFAGLVLSMVGDSMLLLVMAIWVKDLTGSAGLAGLTFLFVAAPSVLAPLGGFLIDRRRRRPFLIWANALSALALLPLFAVGGRGGVPVIFAVAFAYGVSFIATGAALNGLLKELVDDALMAPANGALQSVREGLRLLGPLAGSGLYAAVGAHPVVAIDVVSFLLAAAAIGLLRVREAPLVQSRVHLRDEVLAGLHHVRRTPVLMLVFSTFAAAALLIGFTESAIFAVVDALHRRPSFVGVFGSFQGLGAIAGGLTSAAAIRRLGEVRVASIGVGLFGLGSLIVATIYLPAVLLGAVIAGAGLPWLIVAFYTLVQRTTPQALMGRVSTAGELAIGTPQTLSIGVGALLVGLVDVRVIMVSIFVVMSACAIRLFTAAVAPPP